MPTQYIYIMKKSVKKLEGKQLETAVQIYVDAVNEDRKKETVLVKNTTTKKVVKLTQEQKDARALKRFHNPKASKLSSDFKKKEISEIKANFKKSIILAVKDVNKSITDENTKEFKNHEVLKATKKLLNFIKNDKDNKILNEFLSINKKNRFGSYQQNWIIDKAQKIASYTQNGKLTYSQAILKIKQETKK